MGDTMATPKTITGGQLAAFLRGLLPETRQFDKQIADIEEEALWDSLDAAWAEAEAALPEGWAIERLQALAHGGIGQGIEPFHYAGWRVYAFDPTGAGAEGEGDTPTTALHDLAANLVR